MPGNPTHVLITGASSGIGRALELHYAAPGRDLSLVGRDPDRQEATAAACRTRGAEVETARIDVTDHATLEPWIEARDTARPVDLVIAGAGLGGGHALAPRGGERGQQARDLMAVNTLGVLNTLTPLQPRMARRGAGHVVINGSVQGGSACRRRRSIRRRRPRSGSMPTPRGASCAHRAVTLVLPGFVDTPMSQSLTTPRPWLWNPERGARLSAFPWQLRLAVALGAWEPDAVVDRILTHSLRHTGLAPDPHRDPHRDPDGSR